ncbi:phage portal protein [Sedimenticola selenatireducens]|uniref:Phage portal protein n=1 Tax=Sedimenticola selenatireducens TaxID=191960 RepID=A0A557SCI7_9GAMM|nr:phage portal protein [Sedimenticola selenatireducens]TVO75130.1 phage portal protein [Sedimenticola selenatireducens]TVT67015.1 MAG: phage portal protein [Sedimenticola selenatireducens]
MNELADRIEACGRFNNALEKCKTPGSPILDRFVSEQQASRRAPAVRNETLDSSKIIKGSELFDWMTGGLSASGVAVTEQSAMRVSAVYASVNLIGGALSSLPLPVYQRGQDGEKKRIDHDYWWLLNRQPTDALSAAVFWEFLTGSLLLNGDSFARIQRQGRSPMATGFDPLHKSRVTVVRKDGRLWYHVKNDEGKTEVIDQDDMIHVPGAGFDGCNGQSQIRHALRNAAGISLAADEYSGSFFTNGARPDIALELPGNPTTDQQDMMRNSWNERYRGLGNNHKPALLAGGIKVHELTMNAEDAQLIDTRKFQVEDIARIFGVPPHMIGHTEKTSSWGSGVEQMSIGFVKYTLQRHLVKFEQEFNRKLFRDRKTFVEFNTAGLERGDYKTRNEGYRIALGRAGEPGWITVNEVRKLDNLPPIAGGEKLHGGEESESTA